MTKRTYGQAVLILLGLGAADLAALNLWAAPTLFDVTEVSSATDAINIEPVSPPTAAGAVEPPSPRARVNTEERVEVEPAPLQLAGVINFTTGTWWVGPNGRRTIQQVLARADGDSIIEVAGHADPPGSAHFNQELSEKRAQRVAELIIEAGFDRTRLRVLAFGEEHPSGRGRDRRVEISIRGAR